MSDLLNDLLSDLHEARELIDAYVDVKDSTHGPIANDAMLAKHILDEAIDKLRVRLGQ